ncbi:Thioredoxin-like protein 1-like [Homarus americanus]|uniref:Thioredoxin-like protein 1-like n=1 Tax=Homarus americanus TaxID=6706 RepID=A0A8J5MPK3_HOMAM|nr:Thioredoxin-like protein 1-like [Homarus americanus]
MAGNFKVLTEDAQFQAELNQAGGKLVVADFTSARCGPCQRIAPLFEEMAARFPNGMFLKIDVNQCAAAASSQGVSATPTFIFYRNKCGGHLLNSGQITHCKTKAKEGLESFRKGLKSTRSREIFVIALMAPVLPVHRTKLDSLQGADPETLEARIRQHYGDGEGEEVEDSGVPGHIDLMPMINKAGCECLNESDDHPFTQALSSAGGYLESDTDEQLILYLSFNQAVKLHSMRIKGPAENGPKIMRLFINQPHTIDFDSAECANAVQELTLTTKDLDGELLPLKYVKLQNVMNLTIFVKNNQTDAETTHISYIQIIGSPVQTTKMSDFKRVTGKKGESH